MTATTVEPTQIRLLDAAERLIGLRGVDGVSLRAINAEAASNVAAAHYHYGSKEGLARAVLDRRMSVLAHDRARMLDALEPLDPPPVRRVAEVFAVPLLELSRDPQGADYVRFLAALDRSGGGWLRILDDAFAPQWERFGPVLARATPHLDDRVRSLRIAVAGTTMLHMLSSADRYIGRLSTDEYHEEVVGTVTAILAQEAP